jgi:hypothetical protein
MMIIPSPPPGERARVREHQGVATAPPQAVRLGSSTACYFAPCYFAPAVAFASAFFRSASRRANSFS